MKAMLLDHQGVGRGEGGDVGHERGADRWDGGAGDVKGRHAPRARGAECLKSSGANVR